MLTGKVLDAAGPIAYANVILNASDEKQPLGTITDEQGEFELKLTADAYTLTIRHVGFQPLIKTIALEENLDIGPLILVKKDTQLEEIVVQSTGPLIERRVDRLVFNVQNSLLAKSGSATEALSYAPKVRQQHDGNFEIIGRGIAGILVDSKMIHLSGMALEQYLNSIDADAIEHIEIITDPPAQYDAQGAGGLIHIVMKKRTRDYWGGSVASYYQQQQKPSYAPSGTLQYQRGKIGITSGFKWGKGTLSPVERHNYKYINVLEQNTIHRVTTFRQLSLRNGVSYQATDKLHSDLTYNILQNIQNEEQHTLGTRSFKNQIDATQQFLHENKGDERELFHEFGGQITYQIDSLGKQIQLRASYLLKKQNRSNLLQTIAVTPQPSTTALTEIQSDGKLQFKNHTTALDVTLPTQKLKWTFGAKYSDYENNYNTTLKQNVANDPETQTTRSNDIFDYHESTQALYADLEIPRKKWTVKGGVRIEYTQTIANSKITQLRYTNQYFKAFPSFHFSYTLKKDASIGVHYSSRIIRPNFQWLNPFRRQYTQNMFYEGNPQLLPAYKHTTSLDLTMENWEIELWHSQSKNNQRNYIEVSESNAQQRSYPKNFIDTFEAGISNSYTQKPWSWLHCRLFAWGMYLEEQYNEASISQKTLSKWTFGFQAQSTFILNTQKTLNAQIQYSYDSHELDNALLLRPRQNLSASFTALLFNKKVSIRCHANDIFRGVIIRGQGIPVNGIPISYRNYYDLQRVRLSIRYAFGKKIKRTDQRFEEKARM